MEYVFGVVSKLWLVAFALWEVVFIGLTMAIYANPPEIEDMTYTICLAGAAVAALIGPFLYAIGHWVFGRQGPSSTLTTTRRIAIMYEQAPISRHSELRAVDPSVF